MNLSNQASKQASSEGSDANQQEDEPGVIGKAFGVLQSSTESAGTAMGKLTGALGFTGGMPASRHFDVTLGIDVHPFPPFGGIPFPSPWVGIVFDVFEYLASLGSLLTSMGAETVGTFVSALGGSVKVNGFHKTLAGSESKNIPHIPWISMNEGEVFMGSSTVIVEGEPFAYAALPTLTCWIAGLIGIPRGPKPRKTYAMMLPTTVVIPLPHSARVIVGGPPTISFMNLAFASAFKLFGKALKKLANKLDLPTDCTSCLFKKVAGFVGNPVDASNGQVSQIKDDLSINASLPIDFTRVHVGGKTSTGLLGKSWFDPWSEHLIFEGNQVCFHTAAARTIRFLDPYAKGSTASNHFAPQNTLWREDDDYLIHNSNQGLTKRFQKHSDGKYRLVCIADDNDNRIGFIWDAPTREKPLYNLTQVIHSDGFELRVQTNKHGLITTISREISGDQQLILIDYEYDKEDRLLAARKPNGYFETYTYSKTDKMLSINYADQYLTQYLYDQDGRVSKMQSSTPYNNGQLNFDIATKTTTYTDSQAGIRTMRFNERDLLIEDTDAAGSSVLREWGDMDELLSITDPLNRKTTFTYDQTGQITSVTLPDETQEKFTRDDKGNLLEYADAAGRKWSFEYDGNNNLTRQTWPDGQTETYQLRSTGQVETIFHPNDTTTKLEYTSNNLLKAVVEWPDARTEFTHNATGKITSRKDPDGATTRYSYDVGGNLASAILPDGRELTWEYDIFDNLISSTDGEGKTAKREYGPFGTLERIVDPKGGVIAFEHDTLMRLTKVTNELGENYTYQYDVAGNVARERDFSGRSLEYRYDHMGNLNYKVSAEGIKTEYQYDVMDRLLQANIFEKDAKDPTHQTSYEYDDNGDLIVAINADAKVEFTRDPLGRITDETINGRTVSSEFNERGELTKRNFDGRIAEYQYTPDGLLQKLGINQHSPLQIERDIMGRDISRHTATGFSEIRRWDKLGQLRSQLAGRSAPDKIFDNEFANRQTWEIGDLSNPGISTARNYQYDRAFNPIAITDRRWGKSEYNYDRNDQITTANYQNKDGRGLTTERFTYDKARNIAQSGALTDRGHEIPPQDESFNYSRASGGRIERRGDTTYAYDAQGRMVSKRVDRNGFRPQSWKYSWDAEDQLRRVTTPDEAVWEYRYDPFGRRISKACVKAGKSSAISKVDYLWAGNLLSEEKRIYASGEEVVVGYHYEQGSFAPIAQEVDGDLQYIVTDHLGTPKEVYSEGGELLWSARHELWGRVNKTAHLHAANDNGGYNDCILRFQGQIEDEESGLYYNRFRYYDPESGNYTQADPIRIVGGARLHGYVDNPMQWVDMFGLSRRQGGSHGQVRGDHRGLGGEVNHIPPWNSLQQAGIAGTKGNGYSASAAHMMDYDDHRGLLSTGSSRRSQAHRLTQANHLRNGNWEEAIGMDIDDIRSNPKLKNKYDAGLDAMVDRHVKKGNIDAAAGKRLKNRGRC